MGGSFKWHGDKAKARVETVLSERLSEIGAVVEAEAKRSLSRKGDNRHHASPGQAPDYQTGQLHDSVTHEVAGTVLRVGTNDINGKRQELGTRFGLRRPWLLPAFFRVKSRILEILGRPFSI